MSHMGMLLPGRVESGITTVLLRLTTVLVAINFNKNVFMKWTGSAIGRDMVVIELN